MRLTSYWGQQRMSLTSYPGQVVLIMLTYILVQNNIEASIYLNGGWGYIYDINIAHWWVWLYPSPSKLRTIASVRHRLSSAVMWQSYDASMKHVFVIVCHNLIRSCMASPQIEMQILELANQLRVIIMLDTAFSVMVPPSSELDRITADL